MNRHFTKEEIQTANQTYGNCSTFIRKGCRLKPHYEAKIYSPELVELKKTTNVHKDKDQTECLNTTGGSETGTATL